MRIAVTRGTGSFRSSGIGRGAAGRVAAATGLSAATGGEDRVPIPESGATGWFAATGFDFAATCDAGGDVTGGGVDFGAAAGGGAAGFGVSPPV
jgi:hypothetical protein